jgi:hypothetical protein
LPPTTTTTLLPPQSLWEIVLAEPDLALFRQAVEDAGLVSLFDGTGTIGNLSTLLGVDLSIELGLDPAINLFTAFVPTNAAIEAEPTWVDIQGDVPALRQFVLSHVVPGYHPLAELLTFPNALTLTGDSVTIDPVAQTFNGVPVFVPDIGAPNGIMHVVDSVLWVPTPTPAAPEPTPEPAPDPGSADTDVDGLLDADEIAIGTDPNDADTDDDTLSDYDEYVNYGSSPVNFDSDGDGVDDGSEVFNGTNPIDPSSF